MRREEGLKDGRSVSLLFFFFHKLLRHGEEGGKQVDIFMPPTFFTRKKEKLPTSLWNLNIVHLFISVFFVLFLCRLTAGRTRSYFERSCPSEFTALWVSYGFYINYLTSVASPAIKIFVFYEFADKLLHSEGRELRRALFSLKQIFQVLYKIAISTRRRKKNRKP